MMPIYQKPNTSRPAWGLETYPYLLRELPVERPNQVWRPDITPLAVRRGARHGLEPVTAHASLYLMAIMDWHTRKVPSWRISNILEGDRVRHGFKNRVERLLCRGAEQGHPQVRAARNRDYESGKPVHILRLDGLSLPIRGANIDGRERRSQAHPRHHLHRKAMADPDIRMRSLACPGHRIGDESGDPEMDDLLQSPAPSLSPRRQATGAGLLAAK